MLLVEQLLEKAFAVADRVYALVQSNIVLEAPTSENNLPQRLERALFRPREPCVGNRLNTSAKDADRVVPGWSKGPCLRHGMAHGVSRGGVFDAAHHTRLR